MKKNFCALALAVMFVVCAQAAETAVVDTNSMPAYSTISLARKFGVGVIVGEPTGASVKYWLNDTLALDGAVGWSFHPYDDLYLHGDVLWHDFNLIPVSQGRLPLYFGVGGLARFRDDHNDNEVGVRGPVGLSYMFDNVPVDIFVEVAPTIDVAPSLRGDITGGVGIRYWF